MSLKEPSFIQKHIEKLIMAVAVVFSVVILANFFLLAPFNVDINRQNVSPDQAISLVEREAQRLKNSFANSKIPEEKTRVPQWSDIFVNRYEVSPGGNLELAAVVSYPGLNLDILGSVDPNKPREYYLPGVPIVMDLKAKGGHAVYAASGDTAYDRAIYQIIGNQTPRDFRYISVSGDLDLDQWTERLLAAPDDKRIPSRLWRERMAVAGVFLQRQTLDPNSDTWTDTTIVATLPGQIAYGNPEREPREYSDFEVRDHLLLIADNQQVITRMPFVNTAGGLPWTAPGTQGFSLTADQQEQYTQIQGEIKEIDDDIRRLSRQLGLDRELTDGTPSNDIAPPGSESQPPREQRKPKRELTEREKEAMAKRRAEYDQLLAQRDQLVAQKNVLLGIKNQDSLINATSRDQLFGIEGGMSIDAIDNMAPPVPQALGPDGLPMPGPEEQGEEVEVPRKILNVWAHDLTVEPGKTYRYRMFVTLLNPLFRITGISEEQMQENMNRIAIGPSMTEFAASPWTTPVTLDPAFRYFLVGRSGQGGTLQGRFSVWTIYDGLWRNAEFLERPGDPIGGTQSISTNFGEVQIDMSAGEIVIDLVGDASKLSGALVASEETGALRTIPSINPQLNPELQRLKATAEMEAAIAGE